MLPPRYRIVDNTTQYTSYRNAIEVHLSRQPFPSYLLTPIPYFPPFYFPLSPPPQAFFANKAASASLPKPSPPSTQTARAMSFFQNLDKKTTNNGAAAPPPKKQWYTPYLSALSSTGSKPPPPVNSSTDSNGGNGVVAVDDFKSRLAMFNKPKPFATAAATTTR